MPREKNLCAKLRKLDNPYATYKDHSGTWEWRVLKKYQTPTNEKKNPYARWFCAVRSPLTHGSFEFGDTYIRDIQSVAIKVEGGDKK